MIARRQPPRHFRQQDGADRDANHADRQLIEPVGIIQRRERARRQERRDDGVRKQRDLGSHRTHRRRTEGAKKRADIVVEFERRKLRQDAAARGIAGVILVIATLVLIGWAFHIELLKSVTVHGVAMKSNTGDESRGSGESKV